jgi:hypothetical protein
MEVRDWVRNHFGTADTEVLLDESAYGRNELRTDKKRIEQRLNKLESDMDKHAGRYQQLLEKGAKAEQLKRKRYAQKAKFAKKKYEISKKKHRVDSTKLGTVISIEGMRQVMDLHESQDLTLDEVMRDGVNTGEIQEQIMGQMAQFGIELEDMERVQDALDIDILDEDLSEPASEELDAMERMAAGEISAEQIDVEDSVEIDSEEISIDADIDSDADATDLL